MNKMQNATLPNLANSWEADAPAPRNRLVSVSVFAPQLTAGEVIRAAHGSERMLWRAPGCCAFAAFGVAAELFAWGENRIHDIEQQARALFAGAALPSYVPSEAHPRLMGGFAFRDDFVPDNTWAAFHPAHFILPHVQFVQMSEQPGGWLSLNALVSEGENINDVEASLNEALQARLA